MLRDRHIHICLEALYERRKLARDVFLVVVLLFVSGALWNQQYAASAVVGLTPQSSSSQYHAFDLVQSALSDERLGAIIEKFHLYPEILGMQGERNAIRYMRSRISFQALRRGEGDSEAVRVTYHSQDGPKAIAVANALARSTAEVKSSAADLLPADIAAKIQQQLEDSRSELKPLAAQGHTRSWSRQLQASLSKDERLQAYLREDANKLAALEQQREQAGAAERARITRQEKRIQAAQGRLEKDVQSSTAKTEALSKKFAKSSGYARAYALELDRYHALRRAQKTVQEYPGKVNELLPPRFTLVQPATTVNSTGAASSPLYWLASLLVGLFAVMLAVLLAQRFKTPMRERLGVRSQFKPEELAPQYRHSLR